MKNIIAILLFSLMLSSCADLEEMNINPNLPTETHPQLLLTNVEWDVFRAYGGTSPLYAQKMLVQTDGENTNQYYKWDRGSFGPYSVLRNVTKMIEEAERINEPSYVALGKFFRSYYFFNLTLNFGDVPYTAALKGETDEGYAPIYDEQAEVFKGILAELAEAENILAAQNTIIAGDIIYGGNILSWRKLINAFRLKVLLTLSPKETSGEIDFSEFNSIYTNSPLMENESESGQLVFLDQQNNRYPDFNSSGFSSGMYMDSTFIQRLQERKDPRLFIYSTQTKSAKEAGKAIDDFSAYEGGDPAAPYGEVNEKATQGNVSKVNDRYHRDPVNEPYKLLGYSEQQLILAEAAVRGWINADAKTLYEEGVKASFQFYEMYSEEYSGYVDANAASNYLSEPINDFSKAMSDEEKIQLIVMQKYLQSFFQMQWTSFYDHHRTGYPEFRRPEGVEIPYRWIYPQSEYNYNADNVTSAIAKQFGAGNDNIHEMTWWIK
ncbi:SusD/RagB family nutrient-binding outer membrane lipoprotein [Algoriphagus halophytocola]|uniref:SusD/RagB family nutrient-binding outer membrane lipoprotein n=1 Tax=Algoriphagus halophytocola TaxID=2991499 RepID=UPI0022DD919B|nr:SusD/RagB family nutrient-binding outer membrane lipoprotein [Algoriphagus sp. TR-M9]WBL43478.1 SusD/RagB family nutrient-binding outer membrane lipoprotein [Algoriphagus sp. TR-M9]